MVEGWGWIIEYKLLEGAFVLFVLVILVLLLCLDHFPEGVEGGKDGAASPGWVKSFLWGWDADFEVWGLLFDLMNETFSKAIDQGGTSTENDGLVQLVTEIDIGGLKKGG